MKYLILLFIMISQVEAKTVLNAFNPETEMSTLHINQLYTGCVTLGIQKAPHVSPRVIDAVCSCSLDLYRHMPLDKKTHSPIRTLTDTEMDGCVAWGQQFKD